MIKKFRLIRVLIFILFISFSSAAADKDQTGSNSYLYLNKSNAIEIDIVNVISVSYRNYFTSEWNAAINAQYSGRYNNSKGDSYINQYDEERVNEFSVHLSPTINRRIIQTQIVNFYFGIGLCFTYSNSFRETYSKKDDEHSFTKNINREFGGLAIFQLDVNVIKNIKLYGTYELSVGWSTETMNRKRSSVIYKRNFIELDKLNLGVGICF